MELVYEWIGQSEQKKFDGSPVLQNIDLNFLPKYSFKYDKEENRLSCDINKKKKSDNSFWDKHAVKQINCIIGNNGAGKTTLLKYIYHVNMMADYSQFKFWETIQVFRHQGKFYLYTNIKKDGKGLTYPDIISKISYCEDSLYNNITKIFITDDPYGWVNDQPYSWGRIDAIAFTPYDISNIKSDFLRNATKEEMGLYTADYFHYYNKKIKESYERKDFINNIFYFLLKYDATQNNWDSFNYLNGFKLNIASDYSFGSLYNLYTAYSSSKGETNVFSDNKTLSEDFIKRFENYYGEKYGNCNDNIETFKFFEIYDRYKQDQKSIVKELERYLKTEIIFTLLRWDDKLDINNLPVDAISLLNNFKKELLEKKCPSDELEACSKRVEEELKYFKEAQEDINKFSEIIENVGIEEIIFDFNNNKDHAMKMLGFLRYLIKNSRLFIFKYLDFTYYLSAGERAFLNIFSYINAKKYIKHFSSYLDNYNGVKKDNNNSEDVIHDNVILLLDEPDLCCHPEWQRRMVNEIVKVCDNVFERKNVQIIMSTHSPLLLSDFPQGNIILMKDHKLEVNKQKTFGANLFDLYRNDFFLDDYMGEFAKNKIGNIIEKVYKKYDSKRKDLSKGEGISSFESGELDAIEDIVDEIGEPLIRNNIKRMINYIKGDKS